MWVAIQYREVRKQKCADRECPPNLLVKNICPEIHNNSKTKIKSNDKNKKERWVASHKR
jgi:hypothetical protein